MSFLEKARSLYEEKGAELIRERLGEYEKRIAVGLAGRGSQCYGYDDAISADHDYTLGFCLWINDGDEGEIGLELRRIYRELAPTEQIERSAMGSSGMGVCSIGDFFLPYTGSRGAPEDVMQWLYLPSHALAEASNGQVWRDDMGEFSRIREIVLRGMPEDVRIKKLAAATLIMAQSGQYNYSRCLKRGEEGAAMLAMSEFVKAAATVIFLLNRRHMPYYKWCFRAMGELSVLGNMKESLEFLLTGENDDWGRKLKAHVTEDVCAAVVKELQNQHLSCGSWDYLEKHALDMQGHIQDRRLSSLHILEGW